MKEKVVTKTISLTPSQIEQAKEISKKLFGKSNISGLFGYWIENYKQ